MILTEGGHLGKKIKDEEFWEDFNGYLERLKKRASEIYNPESKLYKRIREQYGQEDKQQTERGKR
jgi:hypothetical protein